MDDDTDPVLGAVIDAIEGGMPVIHAFRQSDGISASDVAQAAGITEERMSILE